MINIILQSALFGLTLTFGVYLLMSVLNRRTGSPLLNPVLLTIIAIVAVLLVFDIPLQDYLNGANIITMMLTPTTALLAYSIYKQLPLLKKYFLPIVLGCLAGSAASMTSVYLLCRLMGLSDTLTYTMIPKSVTTPIAMELSAQLGGIPVGDCGCGRAHRYLRQYPGSDPHQGAAHQEPHCCRCGHRLLQPCGRYLQGHGDRRCGRAP